MNFSRCFLAVLGMSLLLQCRSEASDPTIVIFGESKVRVIPIALKGYTGEANSVLRFDLEVMGFEVVAEDKAQFTLIGKSAGNQVEGRLVDNVSKANLLAKAYTGGTTRSQAHALADDVTELLFKVPGIARTKVAFKVENDHKSNEIYVADYDGHNAIPVTQDKSIVAAPTWMPKAWHLLYTSYKNGFAWIYSHNLTTGERKPFARFAGSNISPAVSSDGNKVAMIVSKAGSPDLWVMNIDGSGLTQLTKTPEDESSPCWSPDGRTICFASRINERRGLYTIPATGGAMRRIDTEGQPNPSEPAWSPDGKWIMFTSQTRSGFNLCVAPAGGGPVQLLVEGEDPSWAPNSRTVIFTRRVGNKRVLSLLDVPTKRVKDTAQNSGSRSQPSWAK